MRHPPEGSCVSMYKCVCVPVRPPFTFSLQTREWITMVLNFCVSSSLLWASIFEANQKSMQHSTLASLYKKNKVSQLLSKRHFQKKSYQGCCGAAQGCVPINRKIKKHCHFMCSAFWNATSRSRYLEQRLSWKQSAPIGTVMDWSRTTTPSRTSWFMPSTRWQTEPSPDRNSTSRCTNPSWVIRRRSRSKRFYIIIGADWCCFIFVPPKKTDKCSERLQPCF